MDSKDKVICVASENSIFVAENYNYSVILCYNEYVNLYIL